MAAQPNLLIPATPTNAVHDQNASTVTTEPAIVKSSPQRDIAWEIVKEECHDILEQLPLSLQRNFSLMRELDEQVTAHLQAIPAVLKEYYELRVKVEEGMTTTGANASGDAIDRPDADRLPKRPVSRASFSSASLTPISESPSTRSLSLPNARNGSGESNEGETEEQDTSFETQQSVPGAPTSIQLITRIATLATDAVRGSLEKVNLTNAAYAGIDRHIRALDIAIAEQEKAIEIGMRPGSQPAASTVVNGGARAHTKSPSFESNGLLALAEVASAVHAAEKTLEAIQPQTTPLSPSHKKEKKEAPKKVEKPTPAAIPRPKVEASKPKQDATKAAKPKQQSKKDRRGSKKDASIIAIVPLEEEEEPIDPNEPTYCYCERVSFGNMIACDGPDCKREWFHYECVGITKEPAANRKWYCRDCEIQEPAKKKRKR